MNNELGYYVGYYTDIPAYYLNQYFKRKLKIKKDTFKKDALVSGFLIAGYDEEQQLFRVTQKQNILETAVFLVPVSECKPYRIVEAKEYLE